MRHTVKGLSEVNKNYADWFSSKARLHFSVMLSSNSLEDLLFLNPHWEAATELCWFRKESSWKQAIFSNSLLVYLEVKLDDNFHSPEYYPFYDYSAPVLSTFAMEACNHQSSSLQPRKSKNGQTGNICTTTTRTTTTTATFITYNTSYSKKFVHPNLARLIELGGA